jgi:hypothetical protein
MSRVDAEVHATKVMTKKDSKITTFTVHPVNDNTWLISVLDPYHKETLISDSFNGELAMAIEKSRLMAQVQERSHSHVEYTYKEPEQMQRGSRLGKIKGSYK